MKKVLDVLKKVFAVFKKPQWLLCLGLGIVLFSSAFANLVNTSAYKVSVTEVKMKTGEDSYLVGLRYAPKTCTEDSKCAVIITTHGYLNSKEMQDEAAVELSKRGYIVYAMDMYDHGDSTSTGSQFTFWLTAQYDAANWVYENEKALLKSADDVGMIAVAGHSMGGFSSRMAAYMDAQYAAYGAYTGYKQRIVAVLAMGADYQWPETFGISADTFISNSGNRSMGTIAGRYDEFFFNVSCKVDYPVDKTTGEKDKTKPYASCDYSGNKVVEKDWGKNVHGKATYYDVSVLEVLQGDYADVESGKWNMDVEGGRVIYVPNEIHPWNHFSTETAAYQIDFYNTAFAEQFRIHNITADDGVVSYGETTGQTWWLKEGFNGIGLVGMFIAITAAIALFAKLPLFSRVATTEINEVAKSTGYRAKLMLVYSIATTIASAWVYTVLNGAYDNTSYVKAFEGIMWACAIITLAAGIAYFVIKAIKGEDENANKVIGNVVAGAIAIFAATYYAYFTVTRSFFTDGVYFNEPGTNTVAVWIMASGAITLLGIVVSHYLNNKKEGYTLANYGLKANWKQILIALLIAVIVVGGVYGITFLVEFLLRVDFRLWTYAIKPFGKEHLVAFTKYLPFFFLFYLINSVSVVATTGHDKTWKGTLKAVIFNILGVTLLLAIHYGQLFITGTAKWPGQALNMILVWAIVPTLGLAAWITRKSYLKTGNIWTAVFINALLFTLMQVANTTLYVS